ncbi:unnamed protein product [Pylaiella littoralis]
MEVTRHRADGSVSVTRPPTTERPRGVGKRCIVQAGISGNSLTRMASGTYDMDVLRDILTTEEEALEELVQMYQAESKVNPPPSFDLLQLVRLEEGERRPFLESSLQACVSDAVPAFIDKYLERTKGLEARVTDAIRTIRPITDK